MIGHITKLFSLSCICGGYYYVSRHSKVNLQSKYLGKIFRLIDEHKPEYSLAFFKLLLRLKLLESNEEFRDYVLKDFDSNGKYLSEVRDLGFKGIEVGPVSFNSSTPDEQHQSIGVKHALSYICTYASANSSQNFEIYLKIEPNYDVLKFAPYLLKENIVQAFKFFADMQKLSAKKIVNAVFINFQRHDVRLQERPQTQKLKSQTKAECRSILQETNQTIKDRIGLDFETRKYKCMSWQQLLDSIKSASSP